MNQALTFAQRIGAMLSRAHYQLLFGVMAACLLPLLLRGIGYEQFMRTPQLINAAAGSLIAVVAGFYFFRRMTAFPGVESLSFIFPIFTISFGAVLAAFFFFRFEYSRYVFLASYLVAQLWFHVVFFAIRRYVMPTFAVIPGGEVGTLRTVSAALWKPLTRPSFDDIPRNGIVTDLRADLSVEWEAFIADAALRGIPVYHYKQVKESITGQVEIEHLSENTFGTLQPNGFYSIFKAVCDRLGAILVIPLVAPLFLVIAAIIRLESRGPAFYRQERVGFRGRPFTLWKFRTMVADVDGSSERRDNAFTVEDDPRITRFGRFLRRTRIDELPQIFNILAGEMSWIGPRPEPAVLSSWFETELPFYRYRHIVKPGITGWAQVNQGYAVGVDDILRKLHYDFYYIKNYSIWLDVLITIKTIRTVITGAGAR